MGDFPIPLDLLAIKATLVLLVALGLAFVLRRASGGARHALWTATTMALLSLPLLESGLPQLPVAWLPPSPTMQEQPVSVAATQEPLPTTPDADRLIGVTGEEVLPGSAVQAARIGWWLGVAWLAGVLGVAAPLLLGVVRSRRLMRGARDVEDARLVAAFDRARAAVGISAPVALRLTAAVRTPMTGGVVRPVVLLPEAALSWTDDCMDAVLRHELVHVRERDAVRQLAARLSVALYWFHPLAWRAARLGALAREMACDEAVLRLGTRPSRYARHLLELADPLPVAAAPALVRLDHPHLEERVMAILRPAPRPATGRLHRPVVGLLFAWTAVVAAAAPSVRPAAASEAEPMIVVDDMVPADLVPTWTAPATVEQAPVAMARLADCEFGRDATVRSGPGGGVRVRSFSTDRDGTRICAAVRGDAREGQGFLPRGRLPAGVLVTLATRDSDGERRLEIEGSSNDNAYRWFVNGTARPFDTAAEEWRDAMFSMVEVLSVQGAAQQREAEVARAQARRQVEAARAAQQEARVAMQRSMEDDRVRRAEAARVTRQALEEVRVQSAEAARLVRRDVEAARLREMEVAGVQEAPPPPAAARAPRPPEPPRAVSPEDVVVRQRVREVQARERQATVEARQRLREAEVREREATVEARQRMREVELRQRDAELAEVRRGVERAQEEVRARAAEVPRRSEAIRRVDEVRVMPAPAAPRVPPAIRERRDGPEVDAATARLRAAIRATGN